jgi:transitional endoplasmic reticulum ATPase
VSENATAVVREVLENSNELIVRYNDRVSSVVDKRIHEEVSSGDVVQVNDEDQVATRLLVKGGYTESNLVGVVKRISSKKVVVLTEQAHISLSNPDDIDLKKEDTVEISSNKIRGKIDVEPPSFDIDRDEIDIKQYRTSGGNIDVSFEDIGGLTGIKERVREVVELPLSKADEFTETGIEPPTGVLFHGPPGTGKTLFARAVADSLEHGTFYNIKGPEILNKWHGESERQLRRLFEDASNQDGPSVLFLDEIESIASSREGSREVDKRLVAQLLTMMDGFEEYENVIVIAATNRPEDIDQALLRPGRFDRQVQFPSKLPEKDRTDILKTISENKDMNISESVRLEDYASMAKDWTGAELERLLNKAGIIAIKDKRTIIKREDIEIAFQQIERAKENENNLSKRGDKE